MNVNYCFYFREIELMVKKKFIVGITGGSGVGKTTLINLLYKKFEGKITTLSLDNYYKPKGEQALDDNGVINFDLPDALYTEHLNADFDRLIQGESIVQKQYNFNNPTVTEDHLMIASNDIILVEGLFVMHYPFLKTKLDYSVYLSVDKARQLERRLKRDVEERNYCRDEVMYQWNNHVLPAYDNYVSPYKQEADLIVTNNADFDENIHALIKVIEENIA